MNPLTDIESNYIVSVTEPVGYAINTGPVETKTPIYDLFVDTLIPNCYLVLVKWVDGTGVWFRYQKPLVVLTCNRH